VNTEAEDAQHYGYHSEKAALVKRLHRIEGQVRGLERMVTEDRYCIDILTHGIGWHSRIAELATADAVLLADLLGEATSAAFMLFGDRVRTDRADWDVRYDVADLSAPAADALVLAVAEQLKVTIV
jgi:DNA-binding FrmR family transcriptional regulator